MIPESGLNRQGYWHQILTTDRENRAGSHVDTNHELALRKKFY